MSININVIGADHISAPLEVRSRFTFTDTQKIDFALHLVEAGCSESVILSTCNRSEVYFIGDPASAKAALLDFFDAKDCEENIYTLCGDDAITHLLRVAAGLESAVIGEDQILGQVGEASRFAEEAGCSKKILNKVFREAMTAAKNIKTRFGISQIPLSVSYIGIRKLSEALEGLRGKTFMVIGTGEMGRLAVRYLEDEGAKKIYLCSRSCNKAAENMTFGETVQLIPFADRYDYIGGVDGVVTATSSPHSVLCADRMPEEAAVRCIVDVAVPADVDESMYTLDGIKIINIDELNTLSEENLERRRALGEEAERVVSEKLSELKEWLFSSRVDTAIESLDRRCGEIAEDTERIIFSKLDLTEREKKLISKMVESGLHRLVREPVQRLKELDSEGKQDEYIAVVKELFGI